MELADIKNLWKEEYKELEKRISINEKIVMEMNMKKQMKDVGNLYNLYTVGNFFGLMYGLISCYTFYLMIDEWVYSIPVLIGGLVMLRGISVHYGIEKPNMNSMSIVELQKSISKFRMHAAKYKMYDGICTIFWMLTIIPAYLKYMYGMNIYGNMRDLNTFLFIIVGMVLYLSVFTFYFYKRANRNLSETEKSLNKLIEFEQ
ncbi:MAG: hypothetical protein ACI94Y_003689 [Maribacter sp.]|jgi:hypothetical protein